MNRFIKIFIVIHIKFKIELNENQEWERYVFSKTAIGAFCFCEIAIQLVC